jgi:short-subunit dehydrogenase
VTALVVGASSGLGRALAAELARTGHDVLLVASDLRDVEAIAADLQLRHGILARAIALDLSSSTDAGARIATALDAMPKPLRALLLPLGTSRDDDTFALDATRIGELLAINLYAPLVLVHALLPRLQQARGVVVLFGSIAGARGRGRNVVYAAAKRALDSLYESLRQRHAPDALHVQLYRLGFLATNLTWGMRLPAAAVKPSEVARVVVARLGRGSGSRYLPRKFGLIALILRAMPWAMFRRMKD